MPRTKSKVKATDLKVGDCFRDPYSGTWHIIQEIRNEPRRTAVDFRVDNHRGLSFFKEQLLITRDPNKPAGTPGKSKGNGFEWITARVLSTWFTGGVDKTQLIRSVQSGGHLTMRAQAIYQVGDLSPNGPAGEKFRSYFAVECKNYKGDPDWWHVFTYETWVVEGWWKKLQDEAAPHDLESILVMLRNGRPVVVMLDSILGFKVDKPVLHIPRLSAAVITLDAFTSHSPEEWYGAIDELRTNR